MKTASSVGGAPGSSGSGASSAWLSSSERRCSLKNSSNSSAGSSSAAARLGGSVGADAGLDPGQRVDRGEARLGQLGVDELVVGGSVGLGGGVLELGLDVEHFGRLVGDRVALLGRVAGVGDRLVLHRRVLLVGGARRRSSAAGASVRGSGASCRSAMLGARRSPGSVGLLPRPDLRGDQELGRRLGKRVVLIGPLRRPKGLVLEPFDLGIIRAMGALQFQVLSDCVVEDAHGVSVRLAKTMRLSFRLRANGINFPATHHGARRSAWINRARLTADDFPSMLES